MRESLAISAHLRTQSLPTVHERQIEYSLIRLESKALYPKAYYKRVNTLMKEKIRQS